MNDRFRFRVWDEESSEYLVWGWTPDYQLEIDLTNGKLVWQSVPDDGDESPKELDTKHLVIEQCTGLKDKNYRLIYEGDIVESTIATRNNKPARDVIKYNNEFAGFEPMCLYDCDCGIYNPVDELIIVGNIHENPELLEDK